MKLRPYQKEAVDSLFSYFKNHNGNPIIAMPPASGKSVVIAKFCHLAIQQYHDTRILIVTHTKELIKQDYDRLLAIWPTAPASIYSAGLRKKAVSQITVGGIGSLVNNTAGLGHVNLIIVDEAHMISTSKETMYRKLISELKRVNRHVKVIGFTATYYRLGHGLLIHNHIFTHIAYNGCELNSFNQFIADGYLSNVISQKTEIEYDLDDVKIKNNEFDPKDFDRVCNVSNVSDQILADALPRLEGRKHCLWFCNSISHADNMLDKLKQRGETGVSLNSKMSHAERDQIIHLFFSGAVRHMTNVGILTTGVDFPALDAVVLCRATMSTVLYVQMVGRLLRIHPDKQDGLLLDYGGNISRLGPINDPVIPKSKSDKSVPGKAPIKFCPVCKFYMHTRVAICTNCAYIFPTAESKLENKASDADVLKLENVNKIVELSVSTVSYRWRRKNDVDFLQIDYLCTDLNRYCEFLFPNHSQNGYSKTVSWIGKRVIGDIKIEPADLVARSAHLRKPVSISVMRDGKYFKIVSYKF